MMDVVAPPELLGLRTQGRPAVITMLLRCSGVEKTHGREDIALSAVSLPDKADQENLNLAWAYQAMPVAEVRLIVGGSALGKFSFNQLYRVTIEAVGSAGGVVAGEPEESGTTIDEGD